jgi:hypothetical protein
MAKAHHLQFYPSSRFSMKAEETLQLSRSPRKKPITSGFARPGA